MNPRRFSRVALGAKLAELAAVAVGSIAVTMGVSTAWRKASSGAPADEVRARRLVLIDTRNREHLALTVGERGPRIVFRSTEARAGFSIAAVEDGISVVDAAQRPRWTVGLAREPRMAVADDQGREFFELEARGRARAMRIGDARRGWGLGVEVAPAGRETAAVLAGPTPTSRNIRILCNPTSAGVVFVREAATTRRDPSLIELATRGQGALITVWNGRTGQAGMYAADDVVGMSVHPLGNPAVGAGMDYSPSSLLARVWASFSEESDPLVAVVDGEQRAAMLRVDAGSRVAKLYAKPDATAVLVEDDDRMPRVVIGANGGRTELELANARRDTRGYLAVDQDGAALELSQGRTQLGATAARQAYRVWLTDGRGRDRGLLEVDGRRTRGWITDRRGRVLGEVRSSK